MTLATERLSSINGTGIILGELAVTWVVSNAFRVHHKVRQLPLVTQTEAAASDHLPRPHAHRMGRPFRRRV